MIRLNILYPNTPGVHFDFDYYLGTHMPMSRRLLGDALKAVTIERGVAGAEPGAPPTYVAGCHMLFESIDTFLEAFVPHMEVLQGDIPAFSNVQPVMQCSDVLPFAQAAADR